MRTLVDSTNGMSVRVRSRHLNCWAGVFKVNWHQLRNVVAPWVAIGTVACGSASPSSPGHMSPPTAPTPAVTYTVSGTIHDALDDGIIVGGPPRVELQAEGEVARFVIPDGGQRGRAFRFEGVRAGTARLIVRVPGGYEEQARTLTVAGNTSADFSLIPLSLRLVGEVVDIRYDDAKVELPPKCGSLVEIIEGVGAGRQAVPDARGRYEFPDILPSGTATVRVTAPGGYQTLVTTLRLRPDGNGDDSHQLTVRCLNCPMQENMSCP